MRSSKLGSGGSESREGVGMSAEVRAYIEAIIRFRDTGRPVVLPVEARNNGKENQRKRNDHAIH
jgi:hypothetical protein